MKKVLYILNSYPQLSQSYIQVEMNTLKENGYEIEIIALRKPNTPSSTHLPYQLMFDEKQIIEYAKSFQPDIIHTHWIFNALPTVFNVAKSLNVGFTVRSHSFDVLWRNTPFKKKLRFFLKNIQYKKILNNPLCKGVLAFPFARDILIQSGINEQKVFPTYPVVDFDRFYNTDKNGTDVINMGAAIAKKGFEKYMKLAKLIPSIQFKLYPIGYDKTVYHEKNKELGSPVLIHESVAFEEMPSVYKNASWLVYTSSDEHIRVGWPLCALEAMASGTGVCLPNIRPDIKDYIGDAGIIYSDIGELQHIISKPVPEDMRKKGFALAKKYDIKRQIHLLTDLWQ